jgi:squalene-hopene/tetraprenyl-beta-curcumene cyclase
MRWTRFLFCAALAAALGASASRAEELTTRQVAGSVDTSLANEARAAIDRGMDWLLAKQQPDGYWSNADFPALTALPLWALVKGGSTNAATAKAVEFILACAREDGSICREPKEKKKGGGLCNYNTALCMVALHAVGGPRLIPYVQRARSFVAGTQHTGSDIYKGGMGYDAATERPYADLSNSYVAYEAMRLTESVEELRKAGDKRADLDWEAARQFVQRIQNLPGSNDQSWASDDPAEKGGFVYKPDASMAQSYTNADGTVRLRSYGSMTYAGLLSFIYAEVNRDDPRVRSAFEWAARHWSIEENPGMGAQGLYYFYNVLAKGLAAYGQDVLTLPDGKAINWRSELINKLVNLQKHETDGTGYWVNAQGRWWEADPVLVTSYSLLALEIALNR